MPRLSQETIALIGVMVAVIGVGVALGALILTTTGGIHDEIQAVRAEARADREASERRAAANREAFDRRLAADREALDRRLTADREASEKRLEASERRLEAFDRRLAADREASERRLADFEKQIIRLTERQGTLGGLVEGLRDRQPTAAGSNDSPG